MKFAEHNPVAPLGGASFITLLGGAAAWPVVAMRRIGVLMGTTEAMWDTQPRVMAF